jgi:hypothetical protein
MTTSYKPPRIFHLRSQDALIKGASPYQQSELYFNIDQNLTPTRDEALVVSVNTAEIPLSFYPVGVNNKTIVFLESTDDDITNVVAKNAVVLTEGNYTATLLATEIARAINASNGDSDYTCVFDASVTKFTIGKTNTAAPKDFQLNLNVSSSGTAYRLLGNTPSVISSTNGAGNIRHIVSAVVANVSGDNALYIRSPLSNINSFESKHGGTSDILAKIPLTNQYNEIQHFSPVANMFKSQLPIGQPLNDLTIRLTNSDNLRIDMNGMDWEFSIVVETINVRRKEY